MIDATLRQYLSGSEVVYRDVATLGVDLLDGHNEKRRSGLALKTARSFPWTWPHTIEAGDECRIQCHSLANPFGRITAVADVFDALLHKRVYRPAWSPGRVLAYF